MDAITLSRGTVSHRYGNKWRLIYKYKDPITNNYLSVQKAVRAESRKEARGKLDRTRAELEEQLNQKAALIVGGLDKEITFEAFARLFIEQRMATKSVAEGTVAHYESRLANCDAINNIPIIEIERMHIQLLVFNLLEKGFAPRTIKHITAFCHQVLNEAVLDGYIQKNPADGILSPKVIKQETKIVPPEDRQIILKALKQNNQTVATVAGMLAFYCGLRTGEIAALKWEDLDFKNDSVTIRRSSSNYFNELKEKETKTYKVRTFPLAQPLKRYLLKWQKLHPEHDVYVLGHLYKTNNLSSLWRKWCEMKHVPYYPLGVWRHTFASLLVKGKEDVATVASIMGHSSIQTTLQYYVGADPKARQNAKATLDQLATL